MGISSRRIQKSQGNVTGSQTVNPTGVAFSAAELVGPGRSQSASENDAAWNVLQGDSTFPSVTTDLFPQKSAANQSAYGDWPGTHDSIFRCTWRSLQPNAPVGDPLDPSNYDFTPIDDMLARLDALGYRLTLRVMSLDSGAGMHAPIFNDGSANVYSVVPEWFRALPSATEIVTYTADPTEKYVVPLWDGTPYLTHFTNFLAALGARYNKDERLACFEMSGLGNWGEWHMAPFGDHYGNTDYPWATQTVHTLVDAHISAFPDTHLLGFTTEVRAIGYQLNTSAQPVRPVGLRNDSLGDDILGGATDRLVDPIATAYPLQPLDRWKTAPMWFEYNPGAHNDVGYNLSREQLQVYHGSNVMSGGLDSLLSSAMYNDWAYTMKYSGYRYSVTTAKLPQSVRSGAAFPFTVTWRNSGVAPTYDTWGIRYSLKPAGQPNAADIATHVSSYSLKSLYYDGNSFVSRTVSPQYQDHTVAETYSVPAGIAPGNYDLCVTVLWQEHKSGGTHAVTYVPMQLAQSGRTAAGYYPLGTIRIT